MTSAKSGQWPWTATARPPKPEFSANCAVATTSPPAPAEPDDQSPAAAYVRTTDWGEGDSAELKGKLRLKDGCLLVEESTRSRTYVPVFPTDFTWDEEARTLTGFDRSLAADAPVVLGGGFSKTPGSHIEHLPPGCEGDALFTVYSMN